MPGGGPGALKVCVFGSDTVLFLEGFAYRRIGGWEDYVRVLRGAPGLLGSEPYHSLRLLASRGRLRTVIAVGDDPALELAVGRGRVVYVYGSPWRLRCPRCGLVVRVEGVPGARPRCPRCGSLMEPEPGAKPVKRMLETAVVEATTASPLVAGGFTEPNYLVLALLVASARLGVTVYCDSTLPAWIPCRRLDRSLPDLLVSEATT